MRRASTRFDIRAALLLVPMLLLADHARADSITLNYSTTMSIGDIGVSGPPVIGFVGLQNASDSAAPQPTGQPGEITPDSVVTPLISLGELIVSPPAVSGSGWSTSYNDTPFYLTVTINSINGSAPAANASSFTVDGYLSGTISSAGTSSVTAALLPPGFPISTYPAGTFGSFPSGDLNVYLTTYSIGTPGNGLITASGQAQVLGGLIAEYATPEPTSWIVFGLLGLAPLAASRLRRDRRSGVPG